MEIIAIIALVPAILFIAGLTMADGLDPRRRTEEYAEGWVILFATLAANIAVLITLAAWYL